MLNRIPLLLIIGAMILSSNNLFGQKADARVDGKNIYNTIAFIASDQFMGRRTNTPEMHEVQDWIVGQYQEWGLEPAGENGTYFQTVPIPRSYANTYGIPELTIEGRQFFARYDDFEIDMRSTADLSVSADLIFAGYGISAPGKGFDEYAGVDVRGKIVLVLKGNPGDFIPPRPRLSDDDEEEVDEISRDSLETWEIESTDSTKIMTAYQKGAAAIILYDPESSTDPFRGFRQRVEKSPFEKDFIVVSQISKEIFYWIFWRDPQMTERGFRNWFDDIRKDLKFARSRSFNTGIEAEITGFEKILRRGEEFGDNQGRNVIAKISGSDPELMNEYIVIGAHLDHVGVTAGQIYNGAEDNASGSAVVIELARLFKQSGINTGRTLIFCLWTGEELGLFGSEHWVENPTDSIMMDRVAYYFNLDMVGIGDKIGAPGALNFPSIWEVVTRDQDDDVLTALKPEMGDLGGSDQTPFMELGIAAVALMTDAEGGHPDYHDTADDPGKMNPEILRKTGQFVLQGAVNLASETDVNLFIPEREVIFSGQYWPITIINPALEAEGSWTWLEAQTSPELTDLITDGITELKNSQGTDDVRRAMRRRFGGTPRNKGIRGPEVVNHDLDMMRIAKEVLNFGRLDVTGNDGIWLQNGLTASGQKAIGALRKSKIALHLINPETETLSAILEKSKDPVLISGFRAYDDSLIAQVKRTKTLIAVDFDPENVAGCLKELETYRAMLDTTSNLVLNVVSEEGFQEAKQELYRELIGKGWTRDEIYAIGGEGKSWRSNGNFDVLPGGRPRFRGR